VDAVTSGQDYEIRLVGASLPPSKLREVAEPVEVWELPPSTVAIYHLADQAELHGLLARLSLSGLDVLEVRPRSTA
jgi:hypothetical protein